MTQKKKIAKIVKGWKTERWLNQEQEAFCQLYATDREFFGNGVQSYIEAYWPDNTEKNWYKTACVNSSKLLSNAKIISRINELLEEWWLNDQNVDKQLSFLITQHSELGNKLWAIKEYNRLKARVIENKTDIHIDFNIEWKSIIELEQMRQQILNSKKK